MQVSVAEQRAVLVKMIKDEVQSLRGGFLAGHESLITKVVTRASEFLNVNADVLQRLIQKTGIRLNPLRLDMKEAYDQYEEQIAKCFGRCLTTELTKLTELKSLDAGFLVDEPVVFPVKY